MRLGRWVVWLPLYGRSKPGSRRRLHGAESCAERVFRLTGSGPRHAIVPIGEHTRPRLGTRLRRECAVDSAQAGNFFRALPEARCQTCQISGAERRALHTLRALDGRTHNIGAALQHEVVAARSPVDSEHRNRRFSITRHAFEHVLHLKTLRFQTGAHHVRLGGATGKAVDGTARQAP